MPIIYTVGKDVSDVGGVGPLELLRGGGGIALLALAHLTYPRSVRTLRKGWPEIGLGLFVLVAALSTFWSVDAKVTILKLVPVVTAYLCLARLSGLYRSFDDALAGVATVAHVILIGTILQFALWPSSVYSSDTFGEAARIHSLVPAIASNLFGLVAAIGIAGICLKIGPQWTTRAPWNVVLVSVYLLLLVGTRSRAVTAVAIVIVLIALIRAAHRSPTSTVVGWAGLLVTTTGATWAFLNDSSRTLITDFFLRGQDARGLSTLTGRTVIWERALIHIEGNEWLGLGYYSGHRIGLPRIDSLFSGYSNLDNTWLENLVGVGVFGTLGMAMFVALGTLRCVRYPSALPQVKLLAILITTGVVALSFINPTVQTNTSTLVFFCVIVFASRPERTPPGAIGTGSGSAIGTT
ncbi:O-antigen ligase family protein [Millisia brevis]|uniref:O-antigen ligase family protein n=1 Tax=Millisia brevis TaxID=264148 RepID=UPI00147101FF|nr:O-antigen ligase family protein [Millisia brevis]